MDPNAYALIVYEGNKIRDDLLNKLNKLELEGHELVQQHDMMIDSSPLSYFKLPDKPYIDYLKVKNPRSPGAIPNSRRRTIELERKYSVNWEIEATQRPNRSWDKKYRHKYLKVTCRSLEEIERFEKREMHPRRRGKGKKKESAEEAAKELATNQTEEANTNELGSTLTIEMFLEDAHNNMLNLFSGHQKSSKGLQKTSPPSSI